MSMQRFDWQAIIFDFDGVVVESGKIKTQAFANLYRSYGEDIVTKVVEFHMQNGGVSRYHKFRYFQEYYLNKPPLTEVEEKQLDSRFSELVVEAVIAAEGVPGAIELIRQQAKKIPLFIASGTPENELKVIVERRGLNSYFKEVRGSPESKKNIIAEILIKHALHPKNVLVIGDAMTDYEGAAANNTVFLGRVFPGELSPFPAHVETVPDLRELVI
ncbi:haloacid dehalogenase superfamily, subfamily IA, variant 1 with third motif having Dx(3-4)D or Dx(3-4)E [Nitrosomonas sp. PY1]|uniref:HAD family hydrolase n=1 Tax=Nitrosomonas sp. PY1 TaxID=1803906 RepID=UPI0020817495|nr:HAD-IA family hydrolase [Nitrosomonas sp. PY1]GKS70050.1 haloacid dehalogenase superfamily, subfamily IA, variant 1 with third motif having Dx(3-4)D or Dx(3-4)E [Nitrosomonas sp. PY1]